MNGIWDEVSTLLKEGRQGIQIALPPSAEIKVKRGRGRPKTRDPSKPYIHFADPRVLKNQGQTKPRCVRKNCYKELKVMDILVCSDECADIVKQETMEALKLLGLREEKRNANGKEQPHPGSGRPRGKRPVGKGARAGLEEGRSPKPKKRTRRKARTQPHKSANGGGSGRVSGEEGTGRATNQENVEVHH